jgi:hypothetical protein
MLGVGVVTLPASACQRQLAVQFPIGRHSSSVHYEVVDRLGHTVE